LSDKRSCGSPEAVEQFPTDYAAACSIEIPLPLQTPIIVFLTVENIVPQREKTNKLAHIIIKLTRESPETIFLNLICDKVVAY